MLTTQIILRYEEDTDLPPLASSLSVTKKQCSVKLPTTCRKVRTKAPILDGCACKNWRPCFRASPNVAAAARTQRLSRSILFPALSKAARRAMSCGSCDRAWSPSGFARHAIILLPLPEACLGKHIPATVNRTLVAIMTINLDRVSQSCEALAEMPKEPFTGERAIWPA